jgi:DNA-binding MarR family transcriptional regulator
MTRVAKGDGGAPAPAVTGRDGACTRSLGERDAAAWTGLLRTRERLMNELDRELEHAHGISLAEYDVLVQLDAAERRSLRMAELADAVYQSRSRLTHTVSRMEKANLVQRQSCPTDRRGVWAQLTDEGMDLIRTAAPTHVETVRRNFVEVMSEEEYAALGRVFAAVVAADSDR